MSERYRFECRGAHFSVEVDGGEHPNGNLAPDQSASVGGQYMGTSDGCLDLIPMGYSLVGRLYTPAGWLAQLEEWEQQVRSQGAAA